MTAKEWLFFNILHHPNNSIKSLKEIKSLSLPDLLDYQESLEAMALLKTGAEKDAEREAKLSQK